MRPSDAPSAVTEPWDADDDSLMKISVSPPQPLEESLGPSPPARVKNTCHAPGLYLAAPLALFADVHPSLLASVPRFNPPWPVLVPPGIFSSASAARHKLFCPVFTCSGPPGARPEPSLKLMIRTGADGSVQGCFCCAPTDARPLTCCFTSVAPVQAWTNTSDTEMFFEMQEQHKNANRADANSKGRRPQHSSGKVKKTAKRCKKDLPLQDLAESALTEYSQVMDALGSKVTKGSEVTDEEDVCALFLNQLLDDSQSTTEASFDMDYISSLLSSDISKDNPEPVAGCSDWTLSTGSEAPPSEVQHDLRPFNGAQLLLSEDPLMENILAPFQDDVKDQTASERFTEALLANPEGQSFQTDLNTSFQGTLHPDFQDFAPETDGNLKDETLWVDELYSAPQSNCFSLQNYKSHHATFPPIVKHDPEPPETPVDGGLENDGEEKLVGPKPEKYTNAGSAKVNNKMDLDIPDDSQRIRKYWNEQTNLKESPKIDQTEENNVNENKKHKRRHRRRKTALPVARTSSKLDSKGKKRIKTCKHQRGKTQRKPANTTKHEAREQEIDLIKISVKRVELQNITEATSSAMERKCASLRQQINKIRGEHTDEEYERRQRRLKTVRRVGKQRMTKNERDCAKTYRCSEGAPKKQKLGQRGSWLLSSQKSASMITNREATKTQRKSDKRFRKGG